MTPGPAPLAVAESDVEDLALQHFANLGYGVVHGPNIAPGESGAERDVCPAALKV